jgi:hypothetical protein
MCTLHHSPMTTSRWIRSGRRAFRWQDSNQSTRGVRAAPNPSSQNGLLPHSDNSAPKMRDHRTLDISPSLPVGIRFLMHSLQCNFFFGCFLDWHRDQVRQAQVERVHRLLDSQERAIVRWLLRHATTNGTGFVHQIDIARVTERCDCGCPSVSISVPHVVPAVRWRMKLVAAATGLVEQSCVSVMLLQHKGFLTSLDVLNVEPINKPYCLPSLESLRPDRWELSR